MRHAARLRRTGQQATIYYYRIHKNGRLFQPAGRELHLNMTETAFGEAEGRPVAQLTLSAYGYRVSLLSYGAAIQSLVLPNGLDVCLGYDTLAEYQEQDGCLGATIGRYANRIGGAAFTINGEEYRLSANEGTNLLHGGARGFDRRVWDYAPTAEGVAFSRLSPEGEEGFPGALAVTVTYSLLPDGLRIRYEAESTRDTYVSLTNHAYFNLAGQGNGTVLGHTLAIAAEEYTPAGAEKLPLGVFAPVAGTALDFRAALPLGSRIGDALLALTRGYDHNFALPGTGMRRAAQLFCPESKVSMAVHTTTEGLQLYTANFLTARAGKDGMRYGAYSGVCLETQRFPDAMHHALFPSPLLRAGARYDECTEYRFAFR